MHRLCARRHTQEACSYDATVTARPPEATFPQNLKGDTSRKDLSPEIFATKSRWVNNILATVSLGRDIRDPGFYHSVHQTPHHWAYPRANGTDLFHRLPVRIGVSPVVPRQRALFRRRRCTSGPLLLLCGYFDYARFIDVDILNQKRRPHHVLRQWQLHIVVLVRDPFVSGNLLVNFTRLDSIIYTPMLNFSVQRLELT